MSPTPGHLNSFFAPAVGHLPVHFRKMLIPGVSPGGGGGGGGWALLELTDALDCPQIFMLCMLSDNYLSALGSMTSDILVSNLKGFICLFGECSRIINDEFVQKVCAALTLA